MPSTKCSARVAMLAVLVLLSITSSLAVSVPSTLSQVTQGFGSIRPAVFVVSSSRFARRGLTSPTNSGDMTFYDVGLGACEYHNSNSELVGALNAPDFGPAWPPRNSPACSSCVLISAPDVPNKQPLKVRIVDKCPECKPGDIDVSPTVFEHFFNKDKGRARITWHTVPCSGDAAPPQRPPAPPAPVVPKPPQVPAPTPPQVPKPSPTTPPRVPDARPTNSPVAPPQRPPQPPVAPVVPSPPAPPKVEPTRPPQDPIAQPLPTSTLSPQPVPVQPPQNGDGRKPGKGKDGNRRKCRPRNRSQSPVQSA